MADMSALTNVPATDAGAAAAAAAYNPQPPEPLLEDAEDVTASLHTHGISAGDLQSSYSVGRRLKFGLYSASPVSAPRESRMIKVVDASEAFIHRVLTGHTNIVSACDVYWSPFLEGRYHEGRYALVMERMEGGDLLELINRNGHAMSEPALLSIALQVGRALEYIHCLGYVHYDIKPENIFFSGTVVKAGDFGLSGRPARHTRLTNVTYMAPEIARCYLTAEDEAAAEGDADAHIPPCITPAADMWSLGAALYTLAVGKLLFHKQLSTDKRTCLSEDDLETIHTQKIFSEPQLLAKPKVRELIMRLLRVNPEERISAHELVQHSHLHKADTNCVILK